MRTWYLALVLPVAVAVVKASKLWGSALDADQTLRDALENAEPLFNTHIAAGFKKLPRPRQSLLRRHEFFFQINSDMTANLQNVDIVSNPRIEMSSVDTDLEHLNMAVEGSVGTIVVVGNFSISSLSSLKTSPVISEGGFRLALESVVFKGYTGLEVTGDSLLTENYDIDYVPSAVTLTVQTGSGNSQISTSAFDGAVSSTINGRLRSIMNRLLKKQFDAVASGYSVSKMLRDQTATISFRSHSRSLKSKVNEYIDALIADIIKKLKNSRKRTISIPGKLHSSFSNKPLLVEWHGSFTATKGWVKDLTTIQRKRSMNVIDKGLVTTVFGRLRLGYLEIGFNHYRAEFMNLGPSGTLRAKVRSNSFFIKLTFDLSEPLAPKAKLNAFYAEDIDDIDLQVTGLGILNWLASKIASWVLDFYTESITKEINRHIIDVAKTSIASAGLSNLLQ